MKLKLIGAEYTNQALLSILPFETGYLLREDEEAEPETPCENSVMLAMMLRGVEYVVNPHKIEKAYDN